MFENFLSQNSAYIEGIGSIVTVLLTLIMTIIAAVALKTYKSQILFELEIEAKAAAIRAFELYLKLNRSNFDENLLEGKFREFYNNRINFYGQNCVEKYDDAILRYYLIEQVQSEMENEMQQLNKVIFKVISTFQTKRKYKLIYKYYKTLFTFFQYYRLNNSSLTASIKQSFNQQDEYSRQILNKEIVKLSNYFSLDEVNKRNDIIQGLMEKATQVE